MVAQLVHVWVVLCHDRDGITLLAYDKARLLLSGIAQVYPIVLRKITDSHQSHQTATTQITNIKNQSLRNHAFRIIADDRKIGPRHSTDLKKLVSILQACLVCNAASSHLGYKDTPILTTDDGDAQRFSAFMHNHVPRLLQVRPCRAKT